MENTHLADAKSNEAAIVDPAEYGLTQSAVSPTLVGLPQIVTEQSLLREEYAVIMEEFKQGFTKQLAKKAKECRSKIKNNRTQGIVPWHKVNKEVPLRLGQFIDATKKKLETENLTMEADLETIEKHEELLREAEVKRLDEERKKELEPFEVENLAQMNLGEKSEAEWNALKKGFEVAYNDRKKAEEEARLAAERAKEIERLEKERMVSIRPLWGFLQEEEMQLKFGELTNEEFEIVLQSLTQRAEEKRIADEKAKIEAEAKAAIVAARTERLKPVMSIINFAEVINLPDEDFEKFLAKAIEIKAEEERIEEQKRKEQEEATRKAEAAAEEARKAAKEAQDKLDAQKKKEEAAAQAEKERLAEEERLRQLELSKGDKEKMTDLKSDIEKLATKYKFESTEYRDLHNVVLSHLRAAYAAIKQ